MLGAAGLQRDPGQTWPLSINGGPQWPAWLSRERDASTPDPCQEPVSSRDSARTAEDKQGPKRVRSRDSLCLCLRGICRRRDLGVPPLQAESCGHSTSATSGHFRSPILRSSFLFLPLLPRHTWECFFLPQLCGRNQEAGGVTDWLPCANQHNNGASSIHPAHPPVPRITRGIKPAASAHEDIIARG